MQFRDAAIWAGTKKPDYGRVVDICTSTAQKELIGPGLLAKVSTVIGDNGGNIIEVFHNRMALDVPAKGAEFDITIETRDARHTQEIIEALNQAGFPPRTN